MNYIWWTEWIILTNFIFTVYTLPTFCTCTCIFVFSVNTCCTILTWIRSTFIDSCNGTVLFTVLLAVQTKLFNKEKHINLPLPVRGSIYRNKWFISVQAFIKFYHIWYLSSLEELCSSDIRYLLISVSQCTPCQPSAHAHVYSFSPSLHVAPFKHGSDAHSSMSAWKNVWIKSYRNWSKKREKKANIMSPLSSLIVLTIFAGLHK